jgi:cytochrome b involved in lipid metabolism
MSKAIISPAEVAAHNSADKGMYIIIDQAVYNVTDFVDEHPGGAKVLQRVAGKDATRQFWKYHNESVLAKYAGRLQVGVVGDRAKL